MPKKSFPLSPKIVGSILIILLILVGLYFYKSRILPKKSTPIQPTPAPKITLNCPSTQTFCQKIKPINKNGKFRGVGATIDPNSPLFAVFEGKIIRRFISEISAKPNQKPKTVQVIIENDQKKLKAVYYLNLKPEESAKIPIKIKAKDIIATVSAQPLKDFDNYNLAFTILDEHNQVIPLEKLEFEKQ